MILTHTGTVILTNGSNERDVLKILEKRCDSYDMEIRRLDIKMVFKNIYQYKLDYVPMKEEQTFSKDLIEQYEKWHTQYDDYVELLNKLKVLKEEEEIPDWMK
jgi:hypothetical protein